MRVLMGSRLALPALMALVALMAPHHYVQAAAVTAGAPENLVTSGGECVRLFHSGGDVGCRSQTAADMAPLFPIASGDELAAFAGGMAQKQDANQKYTLVMAEDLLTSDVVSGAANRIAGAFVFPRDGANVSFDAQMPQGPGTPDAAVNPFAGEAVAWNPDGAGLIAQSLPFTVVLLQNASVGEQFMARASKNLEDGVGVTYKAYMDYYMGPKDMTSLKCLEFKNIYGNRSPRCDPIGGQSSWAMRGDLTSSEIVLAMTSMDSNGFSHVLSPGANTGASGVVALLAAANALKALDDDAFDKKVVFAAFQAEKFGFVGSRKLLSDLKKFKDDPEGACSYPVTGSQSPYGESFCTNPMLSNVAFASELALANISYAIAVDQVGILPSSGNFSVHLNPNANDTDALLDAFVSAPSANGQVGEGSVKNALPPTPLVSFVNGGEYGQHDLVGAVLAGYDSEFSEGVYNSRHDVIEAVDADAVTLAAQVLAESIYTLASANATSANMEKIVVNSTLVTEMLTCIASDWHCDLMNDYMQPIISTMIDYLDLSSSAWPSYTKPARLYPSVLDSDRSMLVKSGDSSYYSLFNGTWSEDTNRVNLFPNAYEVFTRAFLASSMLSKTDAASATTCSASQSCGDSGKGKECVYPGVCSDQRAFYHEASSPGITRTTTALVYDVINSSMPIWTEPKWASDIGSYSFPDPGVWIGWITLLVGVCVTAISVVLSKMLLNSVHKMKLM